jgi:alpha-glucosidase
MLDLTNPDAVAWARAIYAEGLDLGADGWMADFAEWLPHDAVLFSGEDPMLHHNRYPVEWAKLNKELMDEHGGLTFVRSAWLGSQPYVQVIWGGDQQTDFSEGDGLRSVIPIGLGLGVTGFPVYGHDIAGYMSQLTVPTTKELWFRWCTLGALSPVMRTHHGRDARDNWNWERDAETTAHLRRWSKLHVQLVPYLTEALDSGLPVMRPVALHYPELEWAWTTTDQYLLGDRILVAPVLDEGATSREVQLPPGRWYPLTGGPAVEGGAAVTVDAPITEIPAFVAEGAWLLLYPEEVDTLVAAPASASTITPDDTAVDHVVVLFPGTGAAAPGGGFTWTGRDPALPAPTTAMVDGVEVPLTVIAGHVTLTASFERIELAGGGVLVNEEIDDPRTYEVRLRVE